MSWFCLFFTFIVNLPVNTPLVAFICNYMVLMRITLRKELFIGYTFYIGVRHLQVNQVLISVAKTLEARQWPYHAKQPDLPADAAVNLHMLDLSPTM